ncbi:MAG TPA: heme-binding protein, partial [Pyrinomonadaceae bacterium]|nr:heme-binding protein [Pyrinomonadaceae bacterium]
VAVGGVGVEGDGLYTVDRDVNDNDQPIEEIIAVSATRGFEAPALIRADNILVGGIRFPFVNIVDPSVPPTIAFGSLPGAVSGAIIATPASDFIPATLNGVSGQFSSRFPIIAGSALSATEVAQVLGAAAEIANKTRAAIRQPIGTNGRVTMAVVDTDGKVLGVFRQLDAPVFGFDVSVQKARSANFLSRSDAASKLTLAGFGPYVTRANADGILLNGAIAFSDRGEGFLHRPLFPDGINNSLAGPFSTKLGDWSPFNVGLQLDLVKTALTSPPAVCVSSGARGGGGLKQIRRPFAPCPCTAVPELKNGLQIFAGGIPLYRGTTLIGAIGVSGDGIDQDDLVAAGGANLFAPPAAMRSDTIFVRGVRLPFIKFPARPFID